MNGRRVESFLLRLVVQERAVPEKDGWRGRIQHVGSGHERQFEHMQDMVAFISEQIASNRSMVITIDDLLMAE